MIREQISNVNMYHVSMSKFMSASDIQHYIQGGHGVCTIENPYSLNKYTYAFRKPVHEEDFAEGVAFVYVKSGRNFMYVGMMEPDMKFRKTRKSKYDTDSPEFKGAKYICDCARIKNFHIRMNIYHEGICGCCGRKLTDPSSIRLGIGPGCRRKLGIDSFGKKREKKVVKKNIEAMPYSLDEDGQLNFQF